MAKSNTSSYVVTYELAFDNDNPSSVLDKLEKIAKAIYNDCLNECLKRYHKLINDKEYQLLVTHQSIRIVYRDIGTVDSAMEQGEVQPHIAPPLSEVFELPA